MLEFSLLGPLEVRRDGAEIPIGSMRQRTLLVRLLVARGRFVPLGVLVEDLWRGAPPPQAIPTLRSHVSHLRRRLGGPAEQSPLRSSQGTGYALVTGPDAVDTVRFEHLVDIARDHLRSGAPEPARVLLDDALALWRGSALDDVAYEQFAQPEIARLDELRVAAEEDRCEALLASGLHDLAIPDLESLVTGHPLRERSHEQLMLALYRSGRIAEALAVHEHLRDRMADELGLDPSHRLVRLHQQILQQAADLDVDRRGEAGPATTRLPAAIMPRPLPHRVSSFVGRQAELAAIRTFLGETRLVTLVGPGGAGKTTLALAGARALADEFADGVAFVRLSSETEPGRIAMAVAAALGLAADPDTADRAVVAGLAGRQLLLLLDNCEHLADGVARFTEHLLASAPHVHVLATSREVLAIPGELQMPVPPLPPGDAAVLFRDRAREARPALDLAGFEGHVEHICARLDGMPLAIELAAARVRTLAPSEIAERLGDRFALLTAGTRTAEARHRTLRAVVDWSHDLLAGEEQALFRRLAVFHGGWTLPAAEQVCRGGGSAPVLEVLGRLVDRSLVVVADGRYTMLETILAYATERLEGTPDAEETRARHATWYADLAASTAPALRGPDQGDVLRRLHADEHNLRAALAWGRAHPERAPGLALELAASLGWYWYVGRQVDGRAELSAALDAAPDAPPAVRARALQARSLALRPGGCIVHPHPEAARDAHASAALFEASGEPAAAALSRLLWAVEGVGDPDVGSWRASIAASRTTLAAAGDAWGVALADFVEMEILLHDDQGKDALRVGRRAAVAFDRMGDHWGRSAVRLHLGIGLRATGELDPAVRVLEEAVAISREMGLTNNLARSYIELGECERSRGDREAASGHLDAAATIVAELADDLLGSLLASGREAVADPVVVGSPTTPQPGASA